MEWHGLTTREWATLFWIFVLLCLPFVHRPVWTFLRRLAGMWQIHLTMLALVAWLLSLLFVAHRFGWWNRDLLKDTIAWFVVYGFATVLSSTNAPKEDRFFRRAALSALGLGVLMQFLLNLHTFNIVVELFLQPTVTFLILLGLVSEMKPETRNISRFINWVLLVVGLWIVIATGKGLLDSWRGIDPKQTGLAFAFSVWLPLAMLPFVYVLALYMTYGTIFRLTAFRNDGKKASLRARVAVIYGLHGNLREVNDLPQHWVQYQAISRSRGFREAVRHVREYQWAREHRRQEKEIEAARLVWYAGVKGRRADGSLVDQREFKETKDALRWIETCHVGRYNNRGSYQKDLMETVLFDLTGEGLPAVHGITMKVRKDGQAWYAWRRTPSGYVLGIAMNQGRGNEWLYEGWEPPKGFPGQDRAWGDKPYETPPNWG
jgi:hypothetical protein